MKVTFLFFLLAALAMLNVFQTVVEAAPQSEVDVAGASEKVDSPTGVATGGDSSEEAMDGDDQKVRGKGQGQGKGKGKGKGKENDSVKGKGKEKSEEKGKSKGKEKGKGKSEEKGKGKGKGKGQ